MKHEPETAITILAAANYLSLRMSQMKALIQARAVPGVVEAGNGRRFILEATFLPWAKSYLKDRNRSPGSKPKRLAERTREDVLCSGLTFLRTSDVALILGCSPGNAKRLMANGDIPSCQVPGRATTHPHRQSRFEEVIKYAQRHGLLSDQDEQTLHV
jgi:hypothetical protein